MTDPSTPVPSDEAVEEACAKSWGEGFWPRLDEAENEAERRYAVLALTAAYAIDAPRIAAEAAAEARAATLREVEAVLSRWQREAEQIGHHALVDTYKTVRGAVAAHFNPEANE